jgi:hypothetical protein
MGHSSIKDVRYLLLDSCTAGCRLSDEAEESSLPRSQHGFSRVGQTVNGACMRLEVGSVNAQEQCVPGELQDA